MFCSIYYKSPDPPVEAKVAAKVEVEAEVDRAVDQGMLLRNYMIFLLWILII